ncbi:MAG TPA: autotransporter-associated beta strand repeat-containing protein, partial [Opitutales bacterium]|nr:autotransporter-associated beta strand repeat-containing protein [Opitutales bacterium]
TGAFDCNGNMFVDGGRAGVRKFGKNGLPSSIGTQSASGAIASRNGAWLLSLREKDDPIDECDKTFTIFSGDGKGSLVVDGGAVGGVKFTGTWNEHSTSPGHKRIVLTGSNTEECVLSSKFTRKVDLAYPTGGYTFHIRKTGTGVWRMAYNANSTFSGVVAVDNGTLKFDSIAEKGASCALGSALDLYGPLDAHGVALTTTNQVAYAFLLGDGTAAAEGNFEYSGTAAATCSTRPLAVNGRGRLTNGTAYGFNFSDVYTLGTGSNVLTLGGDDTNAMNFLSRVDDGKEATGGPLSLVKEGAGTWRLSGTNDIRGSITVKEGTLVLKNTYTWYRWNFKANQCVIGVDSAGDALSVAAEEFGLYAADGTRLNRGLAGALTYPNLATGEIAPAFVNGTWTPKVDNGSNVSNLCDDGTAFMSQWYYPSSPWYDGDGGVHAKNDAVQHWYPGQPTTWYRILMRLPEDTPIVAGYDVAANNSKVSPSLWSVDASVNGVTWDEVSPDASAAKPSQNNWWLIAGRGHAAGSDLVHTNAQGVADMAAFAKTTPIPDAEFFPNVSSVRVDSGATLKANGHFTVRGLEMDCGGAGKIDGATFAADGTLDLVNYVNSLQPTVLPLVVTNSVGLGNVAAWTVSVEGRVEPGMKTVVKNGKITVFSSGTVIFFR